MIEPKQIYAPKGMRAYESTHIEILAINGKEVVYRFKDEYREHYMSADELIEKFERLER